MTSVAAKKKSLGEKSSSSKQPVKKVHPAFELLQTRQINSLNICVEEYRHKVTGASHFHLASDNVENVFLVAFRDRKSTRLNSSHTDISRMPSSA